MTTEKTKVFELEGRRWQVSKATALQGANILRKFTGKGASGPQSFLSSLNDEEYPAIQNLLLQNVSEIQVVNDSEVYLPVLLPSGAVSKAIEGNARLAYTLMVVSLAFNLQSFFDENALEEFHETMKSFSA